MSSIGENVDSRLSGLPDEILSHILSLMPTKFAVQTSILSKRWRYSWMFVTKLDFGDIHTMDSLRSLTKIVDQVMGFCRPSQVELFRLHFPHICARKPRVSDWIDKAVRLNIRELDLKVHQLQLPLSMFTCKSLTKLRLDRSGYDNQNVWEFKCPINLPCLKILEISVCSNPFVNAFKLISGCPMLESLSFDEFKRREDEEDYIFNIPTLKRLKLTWFFPSSRTHKVILHVPNLEYLFIGACTSSFIMEDVSSLVEACISFNTLYVHQWVELLKGLCGVKSLSVQGYKAFDFKTASISALPIFPNVKYLELKCLEHSALVPQFLESSPELKHLCIETAYGLYSQHKEYSLVEPRLFPACMLTNLTTIKISVRESWWRCDLPFLKYMLGNAEVLKTVTIIWENSSTEKEKLSCAELLMRLPRASRYCEIHFVGN